MKTLVLLTALLWSAACGGDRNTEIITVASQKVGCVGVAPMECLLIRHAGSNDWTFWHGGIEGFDFEPGYEYVLRVRREQIERPPADRPSLRYVLEKIISKKQKTSEGIPHPIGLPERRQ